MIRSVGKIFFHKSSDSFSTSQKNQNIIDFEQKIKTVMTSQESADLLVKNFINHSDDNKYFPSTILDKPTTFLVCICYIKNCIQNSSNYTPFKLEAKHLEAWVSKLTGNSVEIPKEFIKKVKIEKGEIIINSSTYKTSHIKLNKLQPKYYLTESDHPTSKPQKLGIKNVYNNTDCVCDGAVLKFNELFSEANLLPKLKRTELKNNYIKSLKTKNQQLENKKTLIAFEQLQGIDYKRGALSHIQDFYCSTSTLAKSFSDIVKLLQVNNLDHIYCRVLTWMHAQSWIVSKEGVGIKWTWYDPDVPHNSELYSHIFIYPNEIHDDSPKINYFLSKMKHFYKKDKQDIQIVIKCYNKNELSRGKEFTQVDNSQFIKKYAEQEAQELLMIGICTYENKFIEDLLSINGIDVNFHCCDDTPLIQAIMLNNATAVELLLKYGAFPNLNNKQNESPLTIALVEDAKRAIIASLIKCRDIVITDEEKELLNAKYRIMI